MMMNVMFTCEEHAEADNNLIPCVGQETDSLCTEDKDTDTDDKEDETVTCQPIPKYSEPMQCLDVYHHFLSGIHDVPESTVKHLWELENFTSNL
jgi:hypothetical protein